MKNKAAPKNPPNGEKTQITKILFDSESNEEPFETQTQDKNDDCSCIYCNDLFSRSKPGEGWQFADFMKNVHGTSDPLSVAQQDTNDIDALINITETHPFFTQRSMKSKCKKLKKRLKKQQLINQNPTPYSDTESEISSQELY
ncbi:hypothetical protein JTB14_034710 [Gonioctena quinquepunctata]|nr:hypothetical protein JTB14_034710 [Gonioctena quinquepunctata]